MSLGDLCKPLVDQGLCVLFLVDLRGNDLYAKRDNGFLNDEKPL